MLNRFYVFATKMVSKSPIYDLNISFFLYHSSLPMKYIFGSFFGWHCQTIPGSRCFILILMLMCSVTLPSLINPSHLNHIQSFVVYDPICIFPCCSPIHINSALLLFIFIPRFVISKFGLYKSWIAVEILYSLVYVLLSLLCVCVSV